MMMNFETWVVVTKGFEVPLELWDCWSRNVKKKFKANAKATITLQYGLSIEELNKLKRCEGGTKVNHIMHMK